MGSALLRTSSRRSIQATLSELREQALSSAVKVGWGMGEKGWGMGGRRISGVSGGIFF